MRGSQGWARTLTAFAVATGVAVASLLTASVPAPALATGSGIVGLVTDQGGTPLGDIHVETCPAGDCVSTTTSSTVVDGANFRLGPLSPGSYVVSFYDPTRAYTFGYFGFLGFAQYIGEASSVSVGITADGRADIRLPLANRLTGTVTGRGGIPLAGVDVFTLGRDYCVLPRGCLRNTTAVDGTFTIRGLGQGTYQVQFTYPLGNAAGTLWYTTGGSTRDSAAASPITISGSDVRIDAALPLDADSCNRPFEPFRGWTLVAYPYACHNGSSRRTLVGGQELQSVVGGGPGFVALGLREFVTGASPEAAAFTSADGQTWSAVHVDPHVRGDLAAGHGLLVAVGPATGGRSADGATWSVATAPPSATSTVVSVTGGGPGFVAIGQRSAGSSHAVVWTSTDGLRWSPVPNQSALDHFCARSIAGRASGFVAVGNDCHSANSSTAVVITSRDGRTWRRTSAQSVFSGNAVPMSVVSGGPGFIAGGRHRAVGGQWGANLWTSRDGSTWRQVGFFRSDGPPWIVRTTGGFVAVAPGNRAFVSRDGIAWSSGFSIPRPEIGIGQSWQASDAAASGSRVVVVGSYSDSNGTPVEHGGVVWTGAPF